MFVISGATGRVGGSATAQLLDRSAKVRTIVRDATRGDQWATRGADLAVGDLDDPPFLIDALSGADAFFALLPVDVTTTDLHGDQRRLVASITQAVTRSEVAHVVLLSSHGAELASGTGPVQYLHQLEHELLSTGTQLTAIRSGYHQDNIGAVINVAQVQGILPSFLPPYTPYRMVATRDVGRLVADCLLSPPDRSENVDIQGPHYTMNQVAQALGSALDQTVQVVEIPPPGRIEALTQAGMSAPVAEAFSEMYGAFATGSFRPAGDRLVVGTTPIEQVISALTG